MFCSSARDSFQGPSHRRFQPRAGGVHQEQRRKGAGINVSLNQNESPTKGVCPLVWVPRRGGAEGKDSWALGRPEKFPQGSATGFLLYPTTSSTELPKLLARERSQYRANLSRGSTLTLSTVRLQLMQLCCLEKIPGCER